MADYRGYSILYLASGAALFFMASTQQNRRDAEAFQMFGIALFWLFIENKYLADQQDQHHTRRGPYSIGTSPEYHRVMMEQQNDRVFRNNLRMSAPAFDRICSLLRKHPNFQRLPGPGRPPRPVEQQLTAFLLYCGHSSARLHTATESAIGEGSTYNYCDNIVAALLSLSPQVVRMPQGTERNAISKAFGVLGAIGAIDGILIELDEVSRLKDKMAYWNDQKKGYFLNCQVVCGPDTKVLSYSLGFPGSVDDSAMFYASALCIDQAKYFRDKDHGGPEVLLGDEGYPLDPIVFRPFDDTDNEGMPALECQRRDKFNEFLSAKRICVEHLVERLRGRFPMLNKLRGRDIKRMWKMISALLVLHNLLIDLDDAVGGMDGWDQDEIDSSNPLSEEDRAAVEEQGEDEA